MRPIDLERTINDRVDERESIMLDLQACVGASLNQAINQQKREWQAYVPHPHPTGRGRKRRTSWEAGYAH